MSEKITPEEAGSKAQSGTEIVRTFARVVDEATAASYLGLSLKAIRELRYRGKLPTVQWDRRIRYSKEDLDAFIASHRRDPKVAAFREDEEPQNGREKG